MTMRTCLILIAFVALQACSSKIAVMTLEQTIRNAADAAKEGSNGASDKLSIEVAVTNGYKAETTIPIMVVPIEVSASNTVTTKLKMDVDLREYTPRKSISSDDGVYILDTATGILQ